MLQLILEILPLGIPSFKLKMFSKMVSLGARDQVILLLLNHINIAPSAVCPRCGLEDETFLHCVRDCTFSRAIWHHVGFLDAYFFANMEVTVWLKDGSMGSQSFLFASCVWWAWRHRNLMCLNNENWHINRLAYNIHGMVDSFKSCYAPITNVIHNDRFIKWSNGNHIIVLSSMLMHGSCMGTPVRAGFGGVIRNYAGFYLSGFSGYIPDSSDILCVELYTIYQGLILAKSLDITKLVCYSDSLLCINLLKGNTMRFHVYAVLIQDVKDLIKEFIVTICHTLREGNQCADFLAKLGASSEIELLLHASPLEDLLPLLQIDAAGTFYSRE